MWTTTDYSLLYYYYTAIGTIKYNNTYHTTQRHCIRCRSVRCSVLQMNIHFLKRKSFVGKKRITKPCAFPFMVVFFFFLSFLLFIYYLYIYIPIQQHSNGLTGFPECDPLLMVRTSFFTIIIGRMCSNRCSWRRVVRGCKWCDGVLKTWKAETICLLTARGRSKNWVLCLRVHIV